MLSNSNRMNFLNDTQRVLLEDHEENHLSGSDTRIFFENVTMPDITAYAYRVFQNYKPVYSYASYNIDRVLFGNRLIQGQFTLNFKDAQFMGEVLIAINRELAGGASPEEERDIEKSMQDLDKLAKTIDGDPVFTADNFIDVLLSGKEWESLAERFETKAFGADRKKIKRVYEENKPKWTPKYLGSSGGIDNSEILNSGFNVYIVYGIEDIWYNELKELKIWNSGEGIDRDTRAQMASYVSKGEYKMRKEPGTIRILSGVRIVGGPDQSVDVSGVPLQEVYTFIASDIDVIEIKPKE